MIMDNYDPHLLALSQINLQNENLIIHPLIAHTSEQCQPLDIGVFFITKQFDSNYHVNTSLSKQTNQIIKIYHSLSQACSAKNCGSAFRAIGIRTKFENVNGVEREVAYLDITKCIKIRGYQISHIQQLIENNMPLTPNQQFIWQNQNTQEKNKSHYIKLLDF